MITNYDHSPQVNMWDKKLRIENCFTNAKFEVHKYLILIIYNVQIKGNFLIFTVLMYKNYDFMVWNKVQKVQSWFNKC